MSHAADFLAVEVRKQDDLRYRWTLSRLGGRVLDEGVELYIASCLAAATVGADPTSRISVTIDGFLAGDFLAARTQLESTAVALEIARAMLTDVLDRRDRSKEVKSGARAADDEAPS